MIFLESPWPILLIGAAAETILLVALIRTGRGMLLGVMAAVAAVVGLGVLVEQLVVTQRKQVAATIDAAAAALEANDLPRVLELLAPDAEETREKAIQALGMGKLEKVRISNLDITIIRTTSPPTAKATFNVLAVGQLSQGGLGTLTRYFQMTIRLRLESGRWLITGHEFAQDPGRM
jgi:hypothetical protein